MAVIASLLACCAESRHATLAVQRDSAGISIIESVSPAWGDTARWSVDTTPFLDLTTSGTGDPHWFYLVSDAIRLSDGSIAVADNNSDEVRFFSPEGEFLKAVGGGVSAVPLFVRDSHFAAHQGRLYLGDADEMEFKVYSSQGRVEKIIRVPAFDLAVSGEEIQAEREARLQLNPSERNRGLLDAMPNPRTRPAYSNLILDSNGFLWAEESRGRTLTMMGGQPSHWNVFAPTGEWLGKVPIPFRFTVFEVGPDYVLGRRYDDQDVEHVEILRLNRTQASSR
jgi:hypothetical protein